MDKYPVIVADPPWEYKVYSNKGNAKSAVNHYPVMSTGDLMALPVESYATDNAILLLWATWPNLLDGIQLGVAWGFTYKTLGFIWVKRSSGGNGWHTGLGYYTRANSEPCLLFTRGTPKRRNYGIHQLIVDDESVNSLPGFEEVLTARLAAHSAKPEEFFSRVEALLSPPYLELFARHPRKGWTVMGNEVSGVDIQQEMMEFGI